MQRRLVRVIGEEWDTIKEYASKLDDLAFSKCAAVQRLTSKCMKEIGKDLSEQVVPVACRQHMCETCATAERADLWCKHMAALTCALIRN